MRTRTSLLALAALSACIGLAPLTAQATPAENDAAMLKLATDRGCMECHSIERLPKRADGMPPIAPAWRDVSLKYRDDPGAYKRLMQTVLTGSSAKTRHWVGKVGPGDMPPNRGDISEADAQMLVNWILVLVP